MTINLMAGGMSKLQLRSVHKGGTFTKFNNPPEDDMQSRTKHNNSSNKICSQIHHNLTIQDITDGKIFRLVFASPNWISIHIIKIEVLT